MTRRDFIRFFVFGGFLSLFRKKAAAFTKQELKKAMFWRKTG